MRSEGFSFNSGGWSRVRPALLERPQHVRTTFAVRSLSLTSRWAALAKCDQDDVLEVDFPANSVFCDVL